SGVSAPGQPADPGTTRPGRPHRPGPGRPTHNSPNSRPTSIAHTTVWSSAFGGIARCGAAGLGDRGPSGGGWRGAARGSAAAGTRSVVAAPGAGQGWVVRRPALWRELTVGLLVFGVYVVVTGLRYGGRDAAAAGHATDVLQFERWLHLDVELRMNGWLAQHRTLATLANYEYALSYVLSAFVLLFWVYARRPAAYRWARSSFIV